MLTSIPVISPIEVKLDEPTLRRLPAPPDYEVHALPPASMPTEDATKHPAIFALDEMEHATQISEYHDFSWWYERIQVIRTRLEKPD